MDVDLGLKHVEVGPFEFFEVDHLNGVSFVLLDYVDCLEDVAAEPSAQLIQRVIFVLTHPNF